MPLQGCERIRLCIPGMASKRVRHAPGHRAYAVKQENAGARACNVNIRMPESDRRIWSWNPPGYIFSNTAWVVQHTCCNAGHPTKRSRPCAGVLLIPIKSTVDQRQASNDNKSPTWGPSGTQPCTQGLISVVAMQPVPQHNLGILVNSASEGVKATAQVQMRACVSSHCHPQRRAVAQAMSKRVQACDTVVSSKRAVGL